MAQFMALRCSHWQPLLDYELHEPYVLVNIA